MTAGRWICAAAGVGLALRAAFGLFYWVDKPLTHDEREYLALARSVTEGRGFTYDPSDHAGTGQQFGRAPGYPAFLALIGAGGERYESSPARVKIVQAVIGGATVWLIGLIARRAAGPIAGVAAAAIAAVYPPLVWICSYVFSETLYSAVALLAAHTLQLAVCTGSRSSSASFRLETGAACLAAGALAGLAILIRPAMLLFLPLAAAWLITGRRAGLALIFVAASSAVVAPWTLRNMRVHGRFILVASEGGVTFWTGNHPLAVGEGDLAANLELKRAELEFRRAHPGLTSDELEPLYYRDAFRSIAGDPLGWLGLMGRKLFFTVAPVGPSYAVHSMRYRAASAISYLLLLPPAAVGFRRLWRARDRPAAILLLGASAVLVCLVFFPQERFRIPVIDPVLIIAASAAIAEAIRDPDGAAA
jgi:4-amino-4-deoxy-L-arabinose transferase-like glycosyltransferase